MSGMAARRDPQILQQSILPGSVIVASTGVAPFEQFLLDGRHTLRADEPVAAGGGDAGPSPYELLLMALGACTSMTMNLYAARKKWTLDQVVVRLRHERTYPDDCVNCEDPKSKIDRIWCSIELIGALDEAQRTRLIEISKQCPVHRTLTNKIEIRTDLVAP
jgi:putative redox protein